MLCRRCRYQLWHSRAGKRYSHKRVVLLLGVASGPVDASGDSAVHLLFDLSHGLASLWFVVDAIHPMTCDK